MEACLKMRSREQSWHPRPGRGAGWRTPRLSRSLIPAILLPLVLLAVGTHPASAKTQWKSFRPSKSPGRVCVQIGAKDSRYYKLDAQEPVTFTVTGPSRVQLLTRHIPAAGETGEKSYPGIMYRKILTEPIKACLRIDLHHLPGSKGRVFN